MTNGEIAKIMREMAMLYEMDGVLFKPRAYERAAFGIESESADISELYKKEGEKALLRIPGVGKGIAFHIATILRGKSFPEFSKLKKKIPVDISALSSVEGVGPKMIKTLYQELKIKNVADLEKAAKAGKIRKLPHFGEKSEEKILKGIEFFKKSGGRRILGHILPEIKNMEKMIRSFAEIETAIIAGSARRKKETIGDIDILAIPKASAKPETIMDKFIALPFVEHVFSKGKTKTMVKLKNGLDADLRVVPKESYGAALNYFTGSKDHNVKLRELAMKKGLKLNEYGLWRGKKMVAGRTEEEIYKALGMNYIEPEMRENTGELEASRAGGLSKLIGYGDLKGDLQTQTNWTDGEDSIESMAKAAKEMGLEYIVITDHTKALAMTGGSDEKKLIKQMMAIDKINKAFGVGHKAFRVLKGAEVNIMKDGSLDIDNKTLAMLDVAGAAVHSHFTLTREAQTKRVIMAMENPNVDIIFHLTGRLIDKRAPIELDIDEIIKAAKRTKTVLEIDAYPDRSDLKDEYIKKCVLEGVKMSIDSDAHSKAHFRFLEMGIAQARRGWATREDIINAWPCEKMLKMLK
ncbi:MAG: polymerase X family protein [Candidatus Giovannonibacteria bacterium GW2011_GWA2_44_13b]|uniref:DNA-directed DNA polymerase n=2 Tax=Candidatus Giovannoniibacteriota TaxID=1752738 RepID=A0A0G1GZW0_9BACT|nr:MAG: polymerase X family protein [Candidatus Giovannonibacteria bacterium GW2011_GWA2_44_13b]OGF82761.1 MAG: DNA polymerase III [Candidatus Giovannonibacteria bacterium RIFCSPLOWO2_01_FULL_44_16]